MTTVVQITDLHLFSERDGTLLSVPTWETFDEALELLAREVPDWDLLVLTGDLAQDEERATYEALAAALGERVGRTLMIPGNHDNTAHMRAVFPAAFDPSGARFARVLDGWLLIGLDSHVDGQVSGHVGAEQTAWAQEQLSAHPGLPALLFIHHPPAPIGAAWLDGMALVDPEPVGSLVAANKDRIRGVFCGHVHQDTQVALHGVPVFSTPATAFQFTPRTELPGLDMLPPGFRVLELGDELQTRVVRFDSLRFEPKNPENKGY